MRVGLVLGAGGSVGVAYHGAVLAALHDATGWDARDAELIVGTSAGSITAAMLRAGVAAGDLRAISEGTPLSPEGSDLAELGRPRRPKPSAAQFLSVRPLADPRAAFWGITHPHSFPPAALLAALMPAGRVPTEAISDGINAVYAGGWPERPLWLNAVCLRDGARVVFGRDGGHESEVGDAVAASCAIPGYFRPVEIGGRRYVDGGVRSMVNLDVVAGLGLDLVVVSSPMTSASTRPTLAPGRLLRRPLRARLHAEVSALRRSGVRVMTIEPGRRVAAAMGLNPMDARLRGRVSRVGYASTMQWLAEHDAGRTLAGLLSGLATAGGAGLTAGGTGTASGSVAV